MIEEKIQIVKFLKKIAAQYSISKFKESMAAILISS